MSIVSTYVSFEVELDMLPFDCGGIAPQTIYTEPINHGAKSRAGVELNFKFCVRAAVVTHDTVRKPIAVDIHQSNAQAVVVASN